MKFSDMMGTGDEATTTVVDEAETSIPPAARLTEPAPAAPIRFGETRTDAQDEPAAVSAPVATPVTIEPSISDVVSELVPRRPASEPTDDGPLDATAWLEGLSIVADDLLPS